MTTHFELHKGQHPGWRSDEDRPAWLGDGDKLTKISYVSYQPKPYVQDNLAASQVYWDNAIALRFEPPYWAIPALKAGYRPWAGGDEAPEDWDGGDVLFASGAVTQPAYTAHWKHATVLDHIIGYMPATPKPDTGKTYPPELVERMVRILGRIVEDVSNIERPTRMSTRTVENVVLEARALMDEIDPPQVDPLVAVFRTLPLHGDAGCDKLCDEEWAIVAEAARQNLQITEIAA